MEQQKEKKRILLHSCCGPCSTAVVERLAIDYNITLFYYNPNITDEKEYELRLAEEKRFLGELFERTGVRVELIEGPYDPQRWLEAVKGLEGEPEGGARCGVCFRLRLEKAAEKAAELGIELFDSTLSVSPHKSYARLKEAGEAASRKCGVGFLAGDYKKKDGYRRSIELSREYGLYRQDWCGCGFSKAESEARRAAKAASAGTAAAASEAGEARP